MTKHDWQNVVHVTGGWPAFECRLCGYTTLAPCDQKIEKDLPIWEGEYYCEIFLVSEVHES